MQPMKRVYYFTPPEYAVKNLENRSLKISRFSKCNDPFELASFNMRNEEVRRRFRDWLSWMNKGNGLLCFSRNWQNPVMWSHYAQKHTGVCYGFDVDPETFVDVRYVSERLYPDLTPQNFFEHIGENQMVDLFATKFIHWSYEEEVRLLVSFSTSVPDDELIFHEFSESMILRQVIVGPNSDIKVADLAEVVSDTNVEVFKSRLAFQTFQVVRQNNRSLW